MNHREKEEEETDEDYEADINAHTSKSETHRNFIINFLQDPRLEKWRLDGKIILIYISLHFLIFCVLIRIEKEFELLKGVPKSIIVSELRRFVTSFKSNYAKAKKAIAANDERIKSGIQPTKGQAKKLKKLKTFKLRRVKRV